MAEYRITLSVDTDLRIGKAIAACDGFIDDLLNGEATEPVVKQLMDAHFGGETSIRVVGTDPYDEF